MYRILRDVLVLLQFNNAWELLVKRREYSRCCVFCHRNMTNSFLPSVCVCVCVCVCYQRLKYFLSEFDKVLSSKLQSCYHDMDDVGKNGS